mmetsp:Transcript_24691/g.57041  ORF Transcript_24691/g.57041 Transcript_24691/m.57041 type:complete len:381 (+) Transcript_24691:1020-2162(+)
MFAALICLVWGCWFGSVSYERPLSSYSLTVWMGWAVGNMLVAFSVMPVLHDPPLRLIACFLIVVGTMPISLVLTAKKVVAPAESWLSLGCLKEVLLHAFKVNLSYVASVVLVAIFCLDRFYLAGESHRSFIVATLRPFILSAIKWCVAYPLMCFHIDQIASPEYKVLIVWDMHLKMAFLSVSVLTNSTSWFDFGVATALDWGTYAYKRAKFLVLYTPKDQHTWLTRRVTKKYMEARPQPTPGMDTRHWRGYEKQVESMSQTSALLGMVVTFLLLLPFPDSFVTELWFGAGANDANRWRRFHFLVISLALDALQDFLLRAYVRKLTGLAYSRLFFSVAKSRSALIWRLPLLTGHMWMIASLCICYGMWYGERGYLDRMMGV